MDLVSLAWLWEIRFASVLSVVWKTTSLSISALQFLWKEFIHLPQYLRNKPNAEMLRMGMGVTTTWACLVIAWSNPGSSQIITWLGSQMSFCWHPNPLEVLKQNQHERILNKSVDHCNKEATLYIKCTSFFYKVRCWNIFFSPTKSSFTSLCILSM